MEHLFTDSVSDYSDQSALSGIASYFREQLDYENQSAYQCVHRQLYYFLADSCRSIAFHRYFYRWIDSGAKVKDLFIVLWNTVKQLKKTFITVICLVGLSTIMDSSGMIAVIATALATATGSLYPLFAPVIGCLGTFITGSDTSSNILFGKLQANVAGQIHVSPDWLSAANTVGATGGKIISPQSIAIATSAGNQQGKEGEILKVPFLML